MRILFLVAWRNIWRQKKRSLVVISSITTGIFTMMFLISFMNGMNYQMVENTISTSLGHVALYKKNYFKTLKLKYHFTPTDNIYKALKSNKDIKFFAPRIQIQSMLQSSEGVRGTIVVGIDPEKEKNVSKIYDYTDKKNGSRFLQNSSGNGVLISHTLGKKMDLEIGDRLAISITDLNNEMARIGLIVEGYYSTPVEAFNKYMVFMGISQLQEAVGLGKNISEIKVLCENKDKVTAVKKDLLKTINDSDIEIFTWKDMAPNIVSAIDLFDQMMYIMYFIIFFTVIFLLANTMIMAVMERFHELGVMKCIGTRPLYIFLIVVFESICLSIIGLAVGMILSAAVIGWLSISGLDFSSFSAAMNMWKTGNIIYPFVKVKDILVTVQFVFFTAVFAALYPAFKAARIKPLDALNYT